MRERLTLHCDVDPEDAIHVKDVGHGIDIRVSEAGRFCDASLEDRKKVMALYEWLSAYLYPGFSGVFPEKKEEEVPVTKDRKISKGDVVTIKGVIEAVASAAHGKTKYMVNAENAIGETCKWWFAETDFVSVEERPLQVGDACVSKFNANSSAKWTIVAINGEYCWATRGGYPLPVTLELKHLERV